MKRVIFGALVILLAACGSEQTKDSNEQTEGNDAGRFDSVAVDTVQVVEEPVVLDTLPAPVDYSAYLNAPQYFMLDEITVLREYFTDSLIWAYDHCIVNLEEANSDSSLLMAYMGALELKIELSMHVQTLDLFNKVQEGSYYPDFIITDLEEIDKQTMGFFGTCVAECTEFDYTFSLVDFQNKATSTEGEIDDQFFDVIGTADGEYGGDAMGWMSWFVRMWDYGGAVNLGNGEIEYFLKSSKVLMETHDLVNSFPEVNNLLTQYRKNAIGDIKHGVYLYTPEEVSAELDRIIAEHLFENELEELQSWNAKIKSGDYQCECIGGAMQFGCDTGDCDFGG